MDEYGGIRSEMRAIEGRWRQIEGNEGIWKDMGGVGPM